MYPSVNKSIPEFLCDEIVYCDVLPLFQRQHSCLILIRNLMFYEFHNKVQIRSIDLNETFLGKVKEDLIRYQRRHGKLYHEFQDYKGQQKYISFGKFIFQSFEIKKFYLLIKCWNELIILQRTEDSFRLVKQFELVASYKIVQGKIKFQAAVQIFFQNGTNIKTDLQEDIKRDLAGEATKDLGNESFKQLMERIRRAKTELLVHKSMTQKDFQRLKNTQTFGCNFLRGLKLDEKGLLTRYGDIWYRITPKEELIIGIPLINNASATACVTIKEAKPILQSREASLNYIFRFYQTQQIIKDLESIETFFRCEDEATLAADYWRERDGAKLYFGPRSLIVLCIKLKIMQILSIQQAPLFVYFEIEKDVSSPTESKSLVFHQQLFIKNIKFSDVLYKRKQFEISFKPKTLHQDFLAIVSSGNETKIGLKYDTEENLDKFEHLLLQNFDFEKLSRSTEQLSTVKNEFTKTLFYNKCAASIWYGVLVIKCTDRIIVSNNPFIIWKFYTNCADKSYLLMNQILSELVLLNCVKAIEYPLWSTQNITVVEFEHALRKELNSAMSKLGNTSPITMKEAGTKYMNELLKLERKTDLLALSFLDNNRNKNKS